MDENLKASLWACFDRQRIVFWYDEEGEMRDAFLGLEETPFQCIEVDNNEFSVKHRLLIQEPDEKFLLYHKGKEPPLEEHWLLDLALYSGRFVSDLLGAWLQSMGLSQDYLDLLNEHKAFFNSKERRNKLKDRLPSEVTRDGLRYLMMEIVLQQEKGGLEEALMALFQELEDGKDELQTALEKYGLWPFLWREVRRQFAYDKELTSLKALGFWFFQEVAREFLEHGQPASVSLSQFFTRWKDSKKYLENYRFFSEEAFSALGLEARLGDLSLDRLVGCPHFKEVEEALLLRMNQGIIQKTLSLDEIENAVSQKQTSPWFDRYRPHYESLLAAARFFDMFRQTDFSFERPEDGFLRYREHWYKVDQNYRHFMRSFDKAGRFESFAAAADFAELLEQLENFYIGQFLTKLNDGFSRAWSQYGGESWELPQLSRQDGFFKEHVKPFLDKNKKLTVIVSDAMRYEVAQEFSQKMHQLDRFTAETTALLGMLPSYTQLGMASLLPHDNLAFKDDESGLVLVDGKESAGLLARQKILDGILPKRGKAMQASEVLKMAAIHLREVVRDHDVLYVYHNVIDARGDKALTERETFAAVDDCIEELLALSQKLGSANVNNLIVTADHGFLYQERELDEKGYLDARQDAKELRYENRRFLLGKGFAKRTSFHAFTEEALGLKGGMEVQIPWSIQRLRLQGSGARFVHGGASLQEIVLPLVKVNKGRSTDVKKVEVSLEIPGRAVLSTDSIDAKLYQVEAVSEKVHGRALKVGLYKKDGTLVSQELTHVSDSKSEHPRDREFLLTLTLSVHANLQFGEELFLKARDYDPEHQIEKEYQSLPVVYRRAFKGEFDF